MAFLSIHYLMFFPLIYLINWIYIGWCHHFKKKLCALYSLILLLESYAFLIISDWKTALCLLLETIIVYLVSRGMQKNKNNPKLIKTLFIIGIIFCVGQLAIYKYCDFFMQNLCRLFGLVYQDSLISFIPIGISFFTFSAIGYLTDIYRQKYELYENFKELALYLAFFPKFVSGPLIAADKFRHQIKKAANDVNLQNLQIGIQYVVWGMFKKMVIADHLGVFVDEVFNSPAVFDSATCLWAVLSYSLQIYFDFAGYSDMAIGFAKMLGFDIQKNFDLPYISCNVTEFWKRWHISLSTWLQNYVYISLGGNRKGQIRTYLNLILTMLIGGFWHGASWNFIIWGGIHGIALVVHKHFIKYQKKNERKPTKKIWSIVTTFIFICFTWIFFRASNFSQAIVLIEQSISFRGGVHQIYTWTMFGVLFTFGEIIYGVLKSRKNQNVKIEVAYPMLQLNKIWGLFIFFLFLGITIIWAYVGQVAFIYGKF